MTIDKRLENLHDIGDLVVDALNASPMNKVEVYVENHNVKVKPKQGYMINVMGRNLVFEHDKLVAADIIHESWKYHKCDSVKGCTEQECLLISSNGTIYSGDNWVKLIPNTEFVISRGFRQ